MLKKILIAGLVLLVFYMTFLDAETSRVIFSNRSASSKLLALSKQLLIKGLTLLWNILRYLISCGFDLWHRFFGNTAPTYDIRDAEELYRLYQQVARWSGLPWQVFWGIHAEETNLGTHQGTTQVISVLPKQQQPYFYQICKELHWDPQQIYGSHKGAIGPFQFIPETWVRHAIDANGDGRKDPFDVEDAAYSAANYLLSRGGRTDLRKALWHYNQDHRYVARVLRYLRYR